MRKKLPLNFAAKKNNLVEVKVYCMKISRLKKLRKLKFREKCTAKLKYHEIHIVVRTAILKCSEM